MESIPFGELVDRLGHIKSILQNYPFSAGLLRELLQNSDDAKATEQIFLLDCRKHPSRNLCDSKLAETQGPALLAFNNASFTADDWTALQRINKSSKEEDTSKIGKFGLGIRSCYHITDYLQVLSGEHLAIFDPRCSFSRDGGVRLSLEHAGDHRSAFGSLYTDNLEQGRFNGTIVRLPLRTVPSEILENVVSPDDIKDLFKDFIEGELGVAMLFLRHLRSIKLIVADNKGEHHLANCDIEKTSTIGDGVAGVRVHIHCQGGSVVEKDWAILEQHPPIEDAYNLLSKRMSEFLPEEELQKVLEAVLKKHKLRPDVGIAFPLSDSDAPPGKRDNGFLFTFLRLPIETGFPVHIHGCFSLTTSRQNLRNPVDNGLVKGSEGRLLIEWNKILFDFFIPRAWAHLLEVFANDAPAIDLFSAWPALQPPSKSGEQLYWQSLPQALFQIVCERKLRVWPSTLGGKYFNLEEVYIAPPDLDRPTIDALASAGVPICAVPPHLYEMGFDESGILTPNGVAEWLKVTINPPQKPVIDKILCYLLESTGDLRNIDGLQVIPMVSGQYVSLSSDPDAKSTYTLLERDELELFGVCDNAAIHLDELPPSVAKLLRKKGPDALNVHRLDPDLVAYYLDQHPTRKGVNVQTTPATRDAIAFLSQFWIWFSKWGARAMLMPLLEQVPLLPCTHGVEPANRKRPIFERDGLSKDNTALYNYLLRRGVPFITDLEETAQDVLKTYGLLKSPNNIHALLDRLEQLDDVPLPDDAAAETVLQHFDDHMFEGEASQPYSVDQAQTFRELPIFPSVQYEVEGDRLVFERSWIAVDGFKAVYGVSSLNILPKLPDTAFLDCQNYFQDERLLSVVNPAKPEPVSEMAIVALSLEHLHEQPKQLLASILQYAASHRNDLSQNNISLLRKAPFVLSAGDSDVKLAPETLIDPSSPLHQFYPEDCLPRREDDVDASIVQYLSNLSLLNGDLSPTNVRDCIQLVAANPDNFQPCILLLNLLCENGFNFGSLHPLDRTFAWLPTQNEELSDAHGCRPSKRQTSKDDEYLFDYVLEMLHSDVREVPPSLAKVLGWDDPIPTGVLITQLSHVLEVKEGDTIRRVTAILLEMGLREFSSDEQRSLEAVLKGKEWVPVSAGPEEKLVHPWQAVLASPFSGIFRVSRSLLRGEGMVEFLERSGCEESPSLTTVKRRLSELSEKSVSPTTTKAAVAALKFAVENFELEAEHLDELLVPDTEGVLRPIGEVLYNDVGPNSLAYDLGDRTLANAAITEDLAKQLRLQLLGMDSEFANIPSLGENMGASSATIVKETLGNYNEKQFLPEFLANADDAGATQFEVILYDHTPTPGRAYLSSKLKELCAGPAVMVCNDGTFSQKDFDGICWNYIGGKKTEADTIGQFGLGALTMFHITECAFIYSGDKVLILDPAKQYLPIAGRTAILLPLKQIVKWVSYPGHIDCLKDVPWFDLQKPFVNGTVFYLPLRTSTMDALKSQTYTLGSFQSTLLEDFQSKAAECLLFVKIQRIVAGELKSGESVERLWTFEANRLELKILDDSEVVQWDITIDQLAGPDRSGLSTTTWRTVGIQISPDSDSIPANVRVKDMSKTIRIGLAAPLSDERHMIPKLFCTLPLAIAIALPVHVNASFIMSPDRRHIRLDTYDNEETTFNRWLLQEPIPRLYLALLDVLVHDRDNARWWPGILTKDQDSLAGAIVESFYSKHLPVSQRYLFPSMFDDNLLYRFPDIVLHPSRGRTPLVVQKVLEWLSPSCLAQLPLVRHHLEKAGAAIAGPPFVKGILLDDDGAGRVRSKLKDVELMDLITYLANPDPSHLRGLPLLQLEDHSWETINEGASVLAYYHDRGHQLVSRNLFSVQRFVNCAAFPREPLEPPHEGLINVETLKASGVRTLIEERLSQTPPGQPMRQWLALLWDLFPSLPQENLDEEIKHLPLVPTMKDASFKSLLEVKNGEALVTGALEEPFLKECFRDLGIDVVDTNHSPFELQARIAPEFGAKYSPTGTLFARFVRCIAPIRASAIDRLARWSFERQQEFSEWVQKQIVSSVPDDLLPTVQRLPIWTARMGTRISMCSADSITLLPLDTPPAVGLFSRRHVTADTKVTHLRKKRISLEDLHGSLQLPVTLPPGEAEVIYFDFVRRLLYSFGHGIRRLGLRVPSADRTMVDVGSLFEHSTFFDAALDPTSSHFLLPSFNELSNLLLPLIRDNTLDHQLFARCARIFEQQSTDTPEYVQRARVLYERYFEGLALAHPVRSPEWRLLDNINFIPRSMNTTVAYLSDVVELPADIHRLPSVVAPHDVVRREFYWISWTQRVALAEEPREDVDRIKVVYPQFGRPSADVVLQHLHAMSRYPPSAVILHSLRETYAWLDKEENIKDIEDKLEQMSSEPLFLNVDDASGMKDWTWLSANRLALETHDLSEVKAVRKFILRYRRLLKAAGVVEAFYPDVEQEGDDTPASQAFTHLLQMNEYRLARTWADVVLIPYNDRNGEDEQMDVSVPLDLCCHRLVLASCGSSFFKDTFAGGYKEGLRNATSEQPQQIPVPGSRRAIAAVLDYIYTGQLVSPQDSITIEDLLGCLQLADFLNFGSGSACLNLVAHEIAKRQLLDPHNLDEVRESAKKFNSKRLEQYCDHYEEKNEVLIRLARGCR
ncbi:hypothetical protein DFP72DRAFT_810196 [Ephemerocybe angulata]|uniref:BTB domain-containing protein n=1 Tax=Ephemerocybe angulata TaxID=980116 RepID=A0A8H6I3D5_9AGAR|nr:hypothetical protein DFP72DRAFT_810196 [Tulosesus angulatus]